MRWPCVRPARSSLSATSISCCGDARARVRGAAGRVDRGAVRGQRAGVRRDRTAWSPPCARSPSARPACARECRPRRLRERAPVAEVRRRSRSARSRRLARLPISSATCTSAWLPTETKREKPSPASAAIMPISSARLPLCEINPIGPRGRSSRPARAPRRRRRRRGSWARAARRPPRAPAPPARGRARRRVAVRLAGGDHDERSHAGADRLVDRLLERARRHGDDRQPGRAGQLAQRGVRRAAHDLGGRLLTRYTARRCSPRRGRGRASCPT